MTDELERRLRADSERLRQRAGEVASTETALRAVRGQARHRSRRTAMLVRGALGAAAAVVVAVVAWIIVIDRDRPSITGDAVPEPLDSGFATTTSAPELGASPTTVAADTATTATTASAAPTTTTVSTSTTLTPAPPMCPDPDTAIDPGMFPLSVARALTCADGDVVQAVGIVLVADDGSEWLCDTHHDPSEQACVDDGLRLIGATNPTGGSFTGVKQGNTLIVGEGAAGSGSLTHPVLETPWCTSTWLRTRTPLDPYFPYFGRPTTPFPMQVFASPSGSITDPYVVVRRNFDAVDPYGADTGVPGDGVSAGDVMVSGEGGGDARWRLADGSWAHVRNHRFDAAQFLEIARALIPRPADASVPGFDLPAPAPYGLTLLAETMGPLAITGGASSGCTTASGAEGRLVLLRGDTVTLYTAYLDQSSPYPPVTIVADGSASIALLSHDPDIDAARSLQLVRQATTAEQQRMLSAPSQIELGEASLPTVDLTSTSFANATFESIAHVEAAAMTELNATMTAVLPSLRTGRPLVVAWRATAEQAVIAEVWIIELEGEAPNLVVASVEAGIRCATGDLREPTHQCPAALDGS